MKTTIHLILISLTLTLAGCGGGVPADVFPQSVGPFTLKAPPSALKATKGNKMYHGTYVSGNKTLICNVTDFASPNEAIAFVRDTDVVAMDGETKTTADGYRVLGYAPLRTVNEKERIWVLRWNRGPRAYECDDPDGNESDNAAALRDLEKAWAGTTK